ncbi:hypothetical protein JHK87_052527 [Glycine soja]|nr:hypothetical protein JHK87_052527 [Glycine soja]
MKLALNLLNSKDVDKAFRAHINLRALRLGVVGSAIGFVMGCLFLNMHNLTFPTSRDGLEMSNRVSNASTQGLFSFYSCNT